MKPVRKAVLPVAGLGTRVLPVGKTTAKNLLNVVDRPIVSYIVAEGRAAGIEHFVFIVGRASSPLRASRISVLPLAFSWSSSSGL